MHSPPTNGGPHLPVAAMVILAGLAVAYLAYAVFTADRGRKPGQSSFSLGPSARRPTRRLWVSRAVAAACSAAFVLYRNHAYHAVTAAAAVSAHTTVRTMLIEAWCFLTLAGGAVLFALASVAGRRPGRRPAGEGPAMTSLRDVLRDLLGVAWGYRWAALAVFLYSTGQRESWPYSMVQLFACVMMTAMIAAACAHVRAELSRRWWPLAP